MFRTAHVRPYLARTGLLDVRDLNKLRAIGVYDVDALFGLIQSNPRRVSRLLEGTSLARLQADAFWYTSAAFRAFRADMRERVTWPGIGERPGHDVRQCAPALVDRYINSVNTDERETTPRVDLRTRNGADLGAGLPPDRLTAQDSGGVEHLVCRASFDDEDVEPSLYFSCKLVSGTPVKEEMFVGTASDGPNAVGIVRPAPSQPRPPVTATRGAPGSSYAFRSPAATGPVSMFSPLGRRSVKSIQQALENNIPVLIALPVYASWRKNLHVELTGEVVLPLAKEDLEGGHVVCLVGFGDDPNYPGGGAFIFRNSWGPEWAPNSVVGEPGCGVLPYAYVHELAWDAWAWSGAVTPSPSAQARTPPRWWRRRMTEQPETDI